MNPTGLRLILGASAIVIAITAVAYVGFEHLFATATAEAAPVAVRLPSTAAGNAEALAGQEAVVVSAAGRVEKVVGEGRWTSVAPGDVLVVDDSLRTDKGGRAELAIGDKSRLAVTASTQLKVRKLTRAVHQFELTWGRVEASYEADGERLLRIQDAQGAVVAETKAARFSVLSNGQALAVATETGTVDLSAAGKTVPVDAGRQAVAQSGEAPSAATPIPAEVLLKVARARQATDPALCGVVEGTVAPGSELQVGGRSVPIDARGRFKARVPRAPGQVAVQVVMRDVSGRSRESTVPCARAVAPSVELEMMWKEEADGAEDPKLLTDKNKPGLRNGPSTSEGDGT